MLGQIIYDEKEKVTKHFHATPTANQFKGWEMKEFTIRKNDMVTSEGIFCTKCFRTQAINYEQTKPEKPLGDIKNRSKLQRLKKKNNV